MSRCASVTCRNAETDFKQLERTCTVFSNGQPLNKGVEINKGCFDPILSRAMLGEWLKNPMWVSENCLLSFWLYAKVPGKQSFMPAREKALLEYVLVLFPEAPLLRSKQSLH